MFSCAILLDIGDRIALSNVDDETDPTGSFGWIVEGMSHFLLYLFLYNSLKNCLQHVFPPNL